MLPFLLLSGIALNLRGIPARKRKKNSLIYGADDLVSIPVKSPKKRGPKPESQQSVRKTPSKAVSPSPPSSLQSTPTKRQRLEKPTKKILLNSAKKEQRYDKIKIVDRKKKEREDKQRGLKEKKTKAEKEKFSEDDDDDEHEDDEHEEEDSEDFDLVRTVNKQDLY